jgi:hypothetical protein
MKLYNEDEMRFEVFADERQQRQQMKEWLTKRVTIDEAEAAHASPR